MSFPKVEERVLQQIACHPDYSKEFVETQNYLLRGDGPLPYDFRHYIAIMAAARHQCTSIITYHKHRFVTLGGNVEWLKGLDYIPKKLMNLNEINRILAHSPWMLTKAHIEKLTKGKDNWSIGELCQAIVLLAHFHCVCSFVFAAEILDNPDDSKDLSNADSSEVESLKEETVEELMEKMSLLAKKDDPATFVDDRDAIGDHKSDFISQDCTWDDHAYSLLNRFYNEIGTLLDEKFKVAYDLTYYTMGHKENVDTSIFRRAIWNYIHKIYGIIHDDYNYAEIEDLLDYGFRSYVETVCFCPEKILKDAHDEIMRAFRHSEKVHVNLMLFEARFQAELLYALSAIMRYMT